MRFAGASVDYGGAIRNNGTLIMEDCWVSSNSSNIQGGAIYNYFGNLSLYRVTLHGNNTLGNGSAIWAAGATTYVENSTILSNYAFGDYGAIVNAIVELAHNLGMEVIAEGLETGDQLALLQALDCDYGQGSVFSNPLEADEVEALLRKNSRFTIAA